MCGFVRWPILARMKEIDMKLKGMIAGLVMTVAPMAMAANVTFDVAVTGGKSDAGKVLVHINADEAQFDGKKAPVRAVAGELKGGVVTVNVADLPAGKYSISVVHDANANGKLDTNVMGMPTEAFGFSNNPKVRFGPPSFKDTVIEVKDGQPVAIKLITFSFGG
jgi:uncharacterized protein (DUF2141 family)